jgi:hypothetical protein
MKLIKKNLSFHERPYMQRKLLFPLLFIASIPLKAMDLPYQEKLNTKLLKAMQPKKIFSLQRQVAGMKQAIKKGANVDIQDGKGKTPLIWVISREFYDQPFTADLLALILQKTQNVNIKDNTGRTALSYAAWEGDIHSCKLLIATGANVNTCDKFGYTPLIRAARRDYADICKLLISTGANILTDHGENALCHASWEFSNQAWHALITSPLFLAHPSEPELHQSQQNITLALWAFRHARPQLPRDILYKILYANSKLRADISNCPFKIHTHHYECIPLLPLKIIRLLLRDKLLDATKTIHIMKQHCLASLTPLLSDTIENESSDSRPHIKPPNLNTIEHSYGKEIEENIKNAIF